MFKTRKTLKSELNTVRENLDAVHGEKLKVALDLEAAVDALERISRLSPPTNIIPVKDENEEAGYAYVPVKQIAESTLDSLVTVVREEEGGPAFNVGRALEYIKKAYGS